MPHIIFVNYFYDDGLTEIETLLTRYYNMVGWAAGVAEAGATVTICQRFSRSVTFERNQVSYQFMADTHPHRLRGWQIPKQFHERIRAIGLAQTQPTVLHVNGLLYPLQLRHLRAVIPPSWGIVVQHHAEAPWSWPQSWLQRYALQPLDGFIFTHRALANEWHEAAVFTPSQPIYEVMEVSTSFSYQPRTTARAKTGLSGQPILLWTGNLFPNKDPLTILTGFEQLLATLPTARLYMAYRYESLLAEIQAKITRSPLLQQAVTLLGEIPHDEIANYYNSADIFVQGSGREGSGIALLDALACGVIPVVTDIPAFRTVTDRGRVGALWPVGDVDGFVNALRGVIQRDMTTQSDRARQLFHERWHFSAIAKRALTVYNTVLQQRPQV